jgi:multiple sugar transport system substrate-binding protein
VHTLDDGAGGLLLLLSMVAASGHLPYPAPGVPLDADAALPAIDSLVELSSLGVPAGLKDRRPFDVLRDGNAVALWPAAFPYLEAYVEGTRPRLELAGMPRWASTGRRSSGLGGVGLAIASASINRELAWEFASFAMSDEVQRGVWISAGGQPGRLDALRGEAMSARYGELGRSLADALEDSWIRPHWPGWSWVEVQAGAVLMQLGDGRIGSRDALRALNSLVAQAPQHAATIDLEQGANH